MNEPLNASPAGDRLAKIIARSGLCSRRDAEGWIKDGRVAVNGKTIRTPAFNVTDRDEIKVDGAPLAARQGTRVWLYHKPAGLVVTEKDPEGRTTIFEALEQHGLPRVVTIGRLDINTEGLILLTNDGGLKRVLELPATGWLRKYRVRAHGKVTQADLDTLKNGIEIEGIRYGAIEATLEREQGSNVWLQMALREGKNREVKNVLGALGLQVNRLIRISYGPFQLGELPIGAIETVKARVLRDQLGKRLAEEAGVDFDSELPERALKARPVRDRETGRGTNTVEIANQRFRFTDRAEKSIEEVRAERPRQDRPGRSGGRPAPLKPRREEAVDDAPARRVHFEDGRESEDFVAKTYGKKPKFEKGGDRPGGPGQRASGDRPRRDDGDRPAFGDRPKRPFSDRPARDGADRPRREFSDRPKREFSDRPARADGGAPRRDFSDRPKRDFSDRAPRDGADRPKRSFGDRPQRDFADRPKRDFSDRPKRDFGDRAPADGADRPKRAYAPRPPREGGDRPARNYADRPRRDGDERPAFAGKPKFAGKPRGDFGTTPRTGDTERPRGPRPAGKSFAGKPGGSRPFGDKPGGKSFGDKPGGRSFGDKPGGKSFGGKPAGRSFAGKPGGARPGGGASRPAGPGGKPRSPRPPRPKS
ncbi:pseudouridine synthase [Arsenicitalea aurantiaca]|uniref:pseudouridine synthase n=1 Tax=Arsenicitalea aurantiaca TaxID=1783274 RepID=UPI001FCECD9E|nr:pseudouridine synthase [Arsenicitalea aurantiaca]